MTQYSEYPSMEASNDEADERSDADAHPRIAK
jgi:hypothetical protein